MLRNNKKSLSQQSQIKMKRIPAVPEIIQIIEKWDRMKFKCLCTAKEVVSRMKTESSERGMCAS